MRKLASHTVHTASKTQNTTEKERRIHKIRDTDITDISDINPSPRTDMKTRSTQTHHRLREFSSEMAEGTKLRLNLTLFQARDL